MSALRSRVAKWIRDGVSIRRKLETDAPALIQRNMDRGISLREQARHCDCSAAYLSKILNKQDVITPAVYVQLVDATKRCLKLRQTRLS